MRKAKAFARTTRLGGMTEGVVEYAHLRLSFSRSASLFLLVGRVSRCIPEHRSVLPSLIWSLFTCRFTKCSHFKQYPGYSCAPVRRPSRAHTRSDMNTPEPPLHPPAPLRSQPPSLSPDTHRRGDVPLELVHRLSTFPYQPAIPFAAFFITTFVSGRCSLLGPKGPRIFFRHVLCCGHWQARASEQPRIIPFIVLFLEMFFLRLVGNLKMQIFLEKDL